MDKEVGRGATLSYSKYLPAQINIGEHYVQKITYVFKRLCVILQFSISWKKRGFFYRLWCENFFEAIKSHKYWFGSEERILN